MKEVLLAYQFPDYLIQTSRLLKKKTLFHASCCGNRKFLKAHFIMPSSWVRMKERVTFVHHMLCGKHILRCYLILSSHGPREVSIFSIGLRCKQLRLKEAVKFLIFQIDQYPFRVFHLSWIFNLWSKMHLDLTSTSPPENSVIQNDCAFYCKN